MFATDAEMAIGVFTEPADGQVRLCSHAMPGNGPLCCRPTVGPEADRCSYHLTDGRQRCAKCTQLCEPGCAPYCERHRAGAEAQS